METLKNIELILQTATLYFGLIFFIVGASIASFFNVVIFRLPKMYENDNISYMKQWFMEKNLSFPSEIEEPPEKFNLSLPKSHCYHCNTQLTWLDNFPILGYLFLKGKCRYCGTSYSCQYPIIEFLGGVLLLAIYLLFIPQGLAIFTLASIFGMTAFLLAAIDLKTTLLPDTIVYMLMWVGLIAQSLNIHLYPVTLAESIGAAAIGYSILWGIAKIGTLLKGQDAMGDGDLKLVAALGVFVGVKGIIFTIFFAPFIGILTWLIFKLLKMSKIQIPYGPSLILASIIYLFYGEKILSLLQ